MSNSPRPSPSIIASGVVAILGSVLIFLGSALGLLGLLLVKMPADLSQPSPFLRVATLGLMVLGVVCAIFGIATGVGLFLLRAWARVSALVWAGICFSFGLIGIPMALVIRIPAGGASAALPANFALLFRIILLFIYAMLLAVGIWWLVLFSRSSVKQHFAPTGGSIDLTLPQRPRAPVAITVIAWFFVTSAANILLIPVLPAHMPMMILGHFFYPPVGTIIFVLSCALVTIAGIGLLKLEPWSYPLTIGLQLLWLANGIISLLDPNFDAWIKSMIDGMSDLIRMPAGVLAPMDFTRHLLQDMRLFMFVSLLIPSAIVAILFYYRERFLETAAAAKR